jgi:hypothetical protein
MPCPVLTSVSVVKLAWVGGATAAFSALSDRR